MMNKPMKTTLRILAAGLMVASLTTGCTGAGKETKADTPLAGAPPVAEAPGGDSPQSSGEAPVEDPLDEGPGDDSPPARPEGEARRVEVSAEAEAALEGALKSMRGGDLKGARAGLEALLSDPTAGFLASYNLGVLSDREGKLEEAQNYFREALRLNPDFSPALVSLCRLHLREGKPGLAIQVADRYIRQQPQTLSHVDARLQVLVATQRYEDTINEAKALLKRDERNVAAMVNMATAYHRLGKHELAEDVLLQVERVASDRALLAQARYQLGFVYLAMERERQAKTSFEKAVEYRPDFAEARNNLGVLYHRSRDYQGAVEQFSAAISLFPRYREAYLNLGNAFKGLKEYTQAEESFQAAMKIDPAYAPAYFNLGILYLDANFDGRDKQEQYKLAIDNFNRYKVELGANVPREDPADQYIEEAKKKIELEKKREEQRREAQLEAEKQPEDEEIDDEGLDDEEIDDEGLDDEGMDDEEITDDEGVDDEPAEDDEDDVPLDDK